VLKTANNVAIPENEMITHETQVDSELEAPSRAAAGDILHYRYEFTRWGIRDFGVTTRRVNGVVLDSKGALVHYVVEGGFRVLPKEVISIITTFEGWQNRAASTDAETGRPGDAEKSEPPASAGGSSSQFPLETGQ